MAGWPRWKNMQILYFLSCVQSIIIHLTNGAPMVPSGAHEGAIPEGYAVVETLRNTPQPVWKPNFVPVLYADLGWFDWELQPTLSRHLVPTRNPPSPNGGNNVVMQERPCSPVSNQLAESRRGQPTKQPFFKKESQRIKDSASEGSAQEKDGQHKVWRILRREDQEKHFPVLMQMRSSVELNELGAENSVTENPTQNLSPDDPRLKKVLTKEPKNGRRREILENHSEPASQVKSLVGETRGKGKSGDGVPERVSEKSGQVTDENQFQKSTKSDEKAVQETSNEKTVQESDLLKNEVEKYLEPLIKNKKKKGKSKSRSKSKAPNITLDKVEINEAHETEENLMMDAEKKLKDEIERQNKEKEENKSTPNFSEIMQELEKMNLKSLAALDRQEIIYNNFYAAFHLRLKFRKNLASLIKRQSDFDRKSSLENILERETAIPLKEDEIYPGVKMPATNDENHKKFDFNAAGLKMSTPEESSSSSTRGKRKGKGKAARGNMRVEKKANMNRLPTRISQWVETWNEYNLDVNFMHTLQNFLQVHDNSKYLPLKDMHIGTYNVLRDAWTHNRIQFMKGQLWVSEILGVNETLRRIKTMVDHVAEYTLVENWKIIKKNLIDSKVLSKEEAKRIENFYSLSIRFPNPTIINPRLLIQQTVENDKLNIENSIKKYLGIIKEKRPDFTKIPKEPTFYKMYNSLTKLIPMVRSNGIDIDLMFAARKRYETDPDIVKNRFEELSEDMIVPWDASADKYFLSKVDQIPD